MIMRIYLNNNNNNNNNDNYDIYPGILPPYAVFFNVIVQIITVTRSLKSKSLFASIGVPQGRCRSSWTMENKN